LQLGQTQTVGNVRATYSAGRKTYDYQEAMSKLDIPSYALDAFQEIKTDWRAACKAFGVEDIPFTQSEPSVSIKLLS